MDYPLQYASMEASFNAKYGYNGYGYYGLCNKNLQIVDDFPSGNELIFEPNAPKTDFVTKCAGDGTFTDAMQSSLDSSGTYAFPHAYGNEFSIWIGAWNSVTNSYTSNIDDLSMRRRSIGITPLYPTATLKPASETERCSFYEKEISRHFCSVCSATRFATSVENGPAKLTAEDQINMRLVLACSEEELHAV